MASGTSPRSGKKITRQAGIGQLGVNLIEQIVLRMGSAWHPLNPSFDVGIDGEIELVDPNTREATNAIIRVQSKATLAKFPRETDEEFEWPCDDRDLEYWMSGNAPVVLVVSRPHLSEAFWISIKDYFATPERRKEKRIRFNKNRMRLTPESYSDLVSLAIPKAKGIYSSPLPRNETVYSNLLTVTAMPRRLWLADTDLRRPWEVYAVLRDAGVTAPEFVLGDKRILAAHDLTIGPWSSFTDQGTVEEFEASHWSQSDDADLVNRFVELLNRCLIVRCHQIGVEWREVDDFYSFAPTADLSALIVPYRSVREKTKRTVFQPYAYKAGDRDGEVSYYRHNAFAGRFRRYDGAWYLEITPTYFFSHDGRRRHKYYESKLKGIKALEKNATVLGQVVMWAALLRGREETDEGMFTPAPYVHLQFGPLAAFDLGVGIEDGAWMPNEEPDTAASVSKTLDDLPLFADVDPYAAESEQGDDET